MKKILAILFLSALYGICDAQNEQVTNSTSSAQVEEQYFGIDFKSRNLAEAQVRSLRDNRLIFAYIYDLWCEDCDYIEQHIFSDEMIGEYMNENFVNIALFAEEGDGAELDYLFRPKALPAMLILDSDLNLIGMITGIEDTPKDLLKSIDRILAKHQKKLDKEEQKRNKNK